MQEFDILCSLAFFNSYKVGKDTQINCESESRLTKDTPLHHFTTCTMSQSSPFAISLGIFPLNFDKTAGAKLISKAQKYPVFTVSRSDRCRQDLWQLRRWLEGSVLAAATFKCGSFRRGDSLHGNLAGNSWACPRLLGVTATDTWYELKTLLTQRSLLMIPQSLLCSFPCRIPQILQFYFLFWPCSLYSVQQLQTTQLRSGSDTFSHIYIYRIHANTQ